MSRSQARPGVKGSSWGPCSRESNPKDYRTMYSSRTTGNRVGSRRTRPDRKGLLCSRSWRGSAPKDYCPMYSSRIIGSRVGRRPARPGAQGAWWSRFSRESDPTHYCTMYGSAMAGSGAERGCILDQGYATMYSSTIASRKSAGMVHWRYCTV